MHFRGGRVIDLNAGIGDWAFKFASKYPELKVTSIGSSDQKHLLPTQLPPNLRFAIDDLAQKWTFRPEYFGFIRLDSQFELLTSVFVQEVYK